MGPGCMITPSSSCLPCLNPLTMRPHLCSHDLPPSSLTLQHFPVSVLSIRHCTGFVKHQGLYPKTKVSTVRQEASAISSFYMLAFASPLTLSALLIPKEQGQNYSSHLLFFHAILLFFHLIFTPSE